MVAWKQAPELAAPPSDPLDSLTTSASVLVGDPEIVVALAVVILLVLVSLIHAAVVIRARRAAGRPETDPAEAHRGQARGIAR